MAQYATLLSHLSTSKALKERPICVLVQPHISMSFFSRGYLTPPDKDSCTDGLLRMVKVSFIIIIVVVFFFFRRAMETDSFLFFSFCRDGILKKVALLY